MHDVIDIDGSYFTGSKESPHLWRHLTSDGRYLQLLPKEQAQYFDRMFSIAQAVLRSGEGLGGLSWSIHR